MSKRSRRERDARKAIAYVRVSTDEQHLGPEAQRSAIEGWAAREGVSVVAWCVDRGVSGGADLGERPGLGEALGALGALGAGLLVVAKRDRLARDVYVASTIERAVVGAGARVVSADGTANGNTPADAFMRQILDAAAAYERALIRSRTKAALAAKRARGERTGAVPFGQAVSADGRALVTNEGEQRVMRRVHELRRAGYSLRGIVTAAAREGLLSRAGRPLAKTQIERIVARADAA